MIPKLKIALIPFFALLGLHSTFAEANLDLVLAEIKALREQVSSLEARIDLMEDNRTTTSAKEETIGDEPNQPKEKKKWFDSMRVELKKAEARASGGWTTSTNWAKINSGLEEEEAIAILGEPSDRKFSVRKDTDEILIYSGDLSGTGDDVVYGEVRIYKGKVRRFTPPDLPSD